MLCSHLILLNSLILTIINSKEYSCDLLVYESTPSGIMASIAASNNTGLNVILLSTSSHIGGMCSGGLGRTDIHNNSILGGLCRNYFERNAHHYENKYGNPFFWLEPHVAYILFMEMLNESQVNIIIDSNIDKSSLIMNKSINQIKSFATLNGNIYNCLMYIDASYEGDLLLSTDIEYAIGRESSTKYNESLAGRIIPTHSGNQFSVFVNPYIDPLNERSGLLPMITAYDNEYIGASDKRLEAYNYRLCVTKNKTNIIPWCNKPESYNASKWEALRRYFLVSPPNNNHIPSCRLQWIPPGNKYDMNNCNAFGTDFVGQSNNYPLSSYKDRKTIAQLHKNYTLELIYFMCSDESINITLRQKMQNDLGFCGDEFKENNGFPTQFYIRESVRMVSDYVFTQKDAQSNNTNIGKASIGMGSFNFDSHNTQRFVCKNSKECISAPLHYNNSKYGCITNDTTTCPYMWNEGDVQIWPGLYEIPYNILIPKKNTIHNLFVTVCVSASHIGFTTLRLEPQYMIMGESAGVASTILIKDYKNNNKTIDTHNIDLLQLQQQLIHRNQIVHCKTINNNTLTCNND